MNPWSLTRTSPSPETFADLMMTAPPGEDEEDAAAADEEVDDDAEPQAAQKTVRNPAMAIAFLILQVSPLMGRRR